VEASACALCQHEGTDSGVTFATCGKLHTALSIFHLDTVLLADLFIFIIAISAALLFIRWRTRVATQKLLDHPIPGLIADLPAPQWYCAVLPSPPLQPLQAGCQTD